jgi:DNA-binding winged helix-turn-helix (wHTH) protein
VSHRAYRFDRFTVDPVGFRLLREETPIPVSPKLIDLLLFLIARPAVLVTKEELFKTLWPDVIVTDNALTQAISDLRQALGDDPASPRYIQTVARRGYRFIAPVAHVVAEGSAPPVPASRAVAVLDFDNVSGDADLAWLSNGIAETVSNDLRAIGGFRVIDRVRVLEAVRRRSGALAALAADLRVDAFVVGSFQRAGDRLRLTARVVDPASGETIAEAKTDGALANVFDLQDRIGAQLSAGLSREGRAAGTVRVRVRETANLEAYRAFTEGRCKLEALDGSLAAGAVADFERAISLDPNYAVAYGGLANAHFWQYEMSRDRNQPDARLLATAIDDARRAIELDKELAEAHATLGYMLAAAGRSEEAQAAARRAVALEPGYWAHYFRLAHTTWGEERLRALATALELYPDFPFAHFQTAMVHIARGDLDRAEHALREGIVVQDRQAERRGRFPANGLHWLLGSIRLAHGDVAGALGEFDRELAPGGSQLYAREFAIGAWNARGHALLATGDPGEAAVAFGRGLALYDAHARSLLGLARAQRVLGAGADAAATLGRARAAITELQRGRRLSEAAMAAALEHVVMGRDAQAIGALDRLLDEAPPGFAGWTIPIEPMLAALRPEAAFQRVLRKLAERAK